MALIGLMVSRTVVHVWILAAVVMGIYWICASDVMTMVRTRRQLLAWLPPHPGFPPFPRKGFASRVETGRENAAATVCLLRRSQNAPAATRPTPGAPAAGASSPIRPPQYCAYIYRGAVLHLGCG